MGKGRLDRVAGKLNMPADGRAQGQGIIRVGIFTVLIPASWFQISMHTWVTDMTP